MRIATPRLPTPCGESEPAGIPNAITSREFGFNVSKASVCLLALLVFPAVLSDAEGRPADLAPAPFPSMIQVEGRLSESPASNEARERDLRRRFEQAGCRSPQLRDQAVPNELLPNVICTLPGKNSNVIMVTAHYDKVKEGKGVIDNWSGAALLPLFFTQLAKTKHRHTFVFVGFAAEEKGLVGSKYYASKLTINQAAGIRALINLDSLALGPTKLWLHHSDPKLASVLEQLAASMHIPLTVFNADGFGDDDSESFIKRKVPTLMIHSVTDATWPILHTERDNMSSVKMHDYYDTFRLLAAFLVEIDGRLN
jgi:hypothetical protein